MGVGTEILTLGARRFGASASVDLRLQEATSRARSRALIGFDNGGRSRREWERSSDRAVRVCGAEGRSSERKLVLVRYLTTRTGQRSRADFTQGIQRSDRFGADVQYLDGISGIWTVSRRIRGFHLGFRADIVDPLVFSTLNPSVLLVPLIFLILAIEMKKGMHPQLQFISYVTQSGRLMHILMTKLNHVGKVHHLKAKRQIAENVGQIAKFKRRYEQNTEETNDK
ncbi:hypothetical protein KFK09_006484 [Dendrobium nobile]|uniref:Uncharacterized protein n=2 Tax=Dendrobium TaxID=37818 RepID=A0A8T3BUL3_DENNO|nr:hypothetical protein KFK09_006484 [Dendrobium nobile]